MSSPNLKSQTTVRCPCFALPASECSCEPDPTYTQMLEAIQKAHSWLSITHQLMLVMGITSENIDAEWPIHLADAVHYCGEALSELAPE